MAQQRQQLAMQRVSVSGATQPGMPAAAAQRHPQSQMMSLSRANTTQAIGAVQVAQAAQAAHVAPTSSAGPTAVSQPAPQSFVTPYFWEWQNYPGPVNTSTSWQYVDFDIDELRHLPLSAARRPQCPPLQPTFELF